MRDLKFETIMDEAVYFGANSDIEELIRVIANELPWRMVMRIVHKLRRKRGAEE